jgi:hypothetical protein
MTAMGCAFLSHLSSSLSLSLTLSLTHTLSLSHTHTHTHTGESGIGKSTLVDSLFKAHFSDLTEDHSHDNKAVTIEVCAVLLSSVVPCSILLCCAVLCCCSRRTCRISLRATPMTTRPLPLRCVLCCCFPLFCALFCSVRCCAAVQGALVGGPLP